MQEVEEYGIAKYNEKCREIVLTYRDQWKTTIERLGRWVDFENDYKTMYLSYMESCGGYLVSCIKRVWYSLGLSLLWAGHSMFQAVFDSRNNHDQKYFLNFITFFIQHFIYG